jgi:nicotinamidase-related amidase
MQAVNTLALLVIDMQRDFCDPRGYAAHAGMAIDNLRAPIASIHSLLTEARRHGITVIYTREGHRPECLDCFPSKRIRSRRAGAEIGTPGPIGRLLIRGEYGHGIIDELQPAPGDIVVDKPGYGAFFQTDLEIILRAQGIDNLILTGVTTDICVHSTLREAVDRGFSCTTVSDACAASDPELHAAALRTIQGESGIFGEVTSAALLLDQWSTLCA